jgi:hypothetical protein
MERNKETRKKLRLKIRLEERIKKIVKLITEIPARLDGRDVDPLGRGMDWQHRDYDLAYKIRKQIRAGYGWRKILDELPNADRRRLNRMQVESDDSV